MARLARVILPGYPHHITQRGNRRQDVFFGDDDYIYYLELLKEWCKQESLEVWSYCLMTNHVHLIVLPKKTSNLSKAIGETHRRYTRMVNFREKWRGYLWQGRFTSFPMQKAWLLRAAAYVELNPVKAGMVEKPWDYRWSSVHAHLAGVDEFRSFFLVGDKIDTKEYSNRVKVTNDNPKMVNPKTGNYLQKDRAKNSGSGPHGTSSMKIFNKKGKRIGTVDNDGNITRD